jgi:mannose-6-phosphate isomerase-like protein (cupin superfamily)
MIVRHLHALSVERVSHDPEIEKRVILCNGEVPSVTSFARARFTPGQGCREHVHETMYEIYLVERGQGVVEIDGQGVDLVPGVSVTVEPGELHRVRNTGAEDLVLIYFGIAV